MQKLDAAALKAALVNAGLHRAVGGKQSCTAYAAALKLLRREPYHVQYRYIDRLADPVVKAVRGVAGHDEKLRARGLEPARTERELLRGVCAAGEQCRGAVGYIRIAVDNDMQMLLIARSRGAVYDLCEQVRRCSRTHAADDPDNFFSHKTHPPVFMINQESPEVSIIEIGQTNEII